VDKATTTVRRTTAYSDDKSHRRDNSSGKHVSLSALFTEADEERKNRVTAGMRTERRANGE
jgi:hypothetical protein